MKTTATSAFAAALLYASAALASPAPTHNKLTALSQARVLGFGQHAKPESKAAKPAHASDDEYNENWAGGVLMGSDITSVSASFTLVDPKQPTTGQSGTDTWTASTWIGLDGYSCENLWQAGVDGTIDESGAVTYYAWYEWYPAGTQVIEDLSDLSSGDVISVTVSTDSSNYNSGTVVMENETTGKKFSKTVTSDDTLCGTSAEWIVEDLAVDDSSLGLAKFSSITFNDATATTSSGTVGPDGAVIMDVEDTDNEILTSSSVTDSTVVVKFETEDAGSEQNSYY